MCRYGVPDAKLEKPVIDRRIAQLEAEGIRLVYGVEVGVDLDARELRAEHDAVVLAIGARKEREMPIPGRELDGVHAAMDYLYVRNRAVARMEGRVAREPEVPISATRKRVVVLGGGDTGMDCVSNANREGAASVTLLDTYDVPGPDGRFESTPWPLQPHRTPTTYALEEGPERENRKIVTEFVGEGGKVVAVRGAEMRGRARDPELVPGTEFEIPGDLVLIAIGFDGPEQDGAIAQLGVETDRRTNVKAGMFRTSVSGVYTCGDARVGATLIVTAIDEGRRCARVVNRDLTGSEVLAADPDTGAPPPRAVRSEPLDVEVV
jgi:glutamate synthase (NADPH/NADH) small chain